MIWVNTVQYFSSILSMCTAGITRRICGRQVNSPAHRLSYPAKARERDKKSVGAFIPAPPPALVGASSRLKNERAGGTRRHGIIAQWQSRGL